MGDAYREPVYTIGVTANMLNVCQATLRIWERKGLIKPSRIGKNRFFSRQDLDQLQYIHDLLQKKHINIQGVKSIITTTKCWELKKCVEKERVVCPVFLKFKRV